MSGDSYLQAWFPSRRITADRTSETIVLTCGD